MIATQAARPAPVTGWWRVTGVLGLAWFVLFALGGIVLQGEPPAYDQPLQATRDFFAAGAGRYLLGDYVAGVAFTLLLLPFTAGLAGVLGLAEAEPRVASRLVFAGGLATVVIGGTATVFLDAVALGDGATRLGDGTLRGLLHMNAVAISAIGLPMALTVFAAAVAIWTTSVLWRWLAPLAVLSGLLNVVGALYVLPGDLDGPLFAVRFAGLITFALLVVLISANLIKGPRAALPQPPRPSS